MTHEADVPLAHSRWLNPASLHMECRHITILASIKAVLSSLRTSEGQISPGRAWGDSTARKVAMARIRQVTKDAIGGDMPVMSLRYRYSRRRTWKSTEPETSSARMQPSDQMSTFWLYRMPRMTSGALYDRDWTYELR